MNWFDILTVGYAKTIQALIAYLITWGAFAVLLYIVMDLIPGHKLASMIGAGVIVILIAAFNLLLLVQDRGGFDR